MLVADCWRGLKLGAAACSRRCDGKDRCGSLGECLEDVGREDVFGVTVSGERFTSWLKVEVGRLPPEAGGLPFRGDELPEARFSLADASVGDRSAFMSISQRQKTS